MNRNCFGHRYFFCIRRFNFVQGVPVEVPIGDEDGKFLVPTLSCQKSIHSFMLTFFLQEPKSKVFQLFFRHSTPQLDTNGRGSTSTCDSLKRTLCVFFLSL
jgi:hypothetical protein